MKFLAWVLSPALIALTSFVGPASSPGPLASGVGKVGTFLLATAPYAGPSPDETLDASDQALRVAQEAAEAEQARLAQEAAELRQRAVQRPPAVASPVTGPIVVDYDRWAFIHRCEAITWTDYGTNAANPGGLVFAGGLGMSTGAWSMAVAYAAARGVELPGSALDATPDQQQIGAQAFFDVHGPSPWTGFCYRP